MVVYINNDEDSNHNPNNNDDNDNINNNYDNGGFLSILKDIHAERNVVFYG